MQPLHIKDEHSTEDEFNRMKNLRIKKTAHDSQFDTEPTVF